MELDLLDGQLLAACERGCLETLRMLLMQGARPGTRNPDTGMTGIYVAASKGHAQVIDLLVRQGADVDQPEAEGFSPLYIAAKNDNCAVAEALILGQACLNGGHPQGGTPLLIAAQLGHSGMLRRLIAAGADVCRGNWKGTTPTYIAAQKGSAGIIAQLLAAGADPNQPETDGTAPLWVAAQNGHLEAARLLIRSGCKVNPRRLETGSTPLFIAAECGLLEMVELLLEAGADPQLPKLSGEVPIYSAAWEGHLKVVQRLLAAGAEVDAAQFDGKTPLQRAVIEDHPSVVQCLADAGADVNWVAAASTGFTPLLEAARLGNAAMAQLLLQLGADATLAASVVDSNGDSQFATPLRKAVEFRHESVVRVLLAGAASLELDFREAFQRDALECIRLARIDGLDRLGDLLHAFCYPSAAGQLGEHPDEELDAGSEPNQSPTSAEDQLQPISSLELHEAFNAAGFRDDRAAFQCVMADVLEEVIRGVRNTPNVHLVGSYSEGWGNSLVSLNGRTDADSDLDVTEYAHQRLFHIRGRCRCSNPNTEDVLPYSAGHVLYKGASSNPSLPDKGSDLRPAMDIVDAYACCCYPEISALLPGSDEASRLPQDLVAQLRAELLQPRSCHLIRASAPGFEGRQLRVSTTFLEKPFMRSLTAVQGQLFLTLKYLIKRVISKVCGVRGLKSYHAKTLTFRLVASRDASVWKPERLTELVCAALDDLLSCLAASPPGECMPHFFMSDAPLYLRRSSSAKQDVVAAVTSVKASLQRHLTKLAAHLQTLRHASFRLHPFTLLPVYLPLPWPKSGQLEYHNIYAVVCELVLKLSTPESPPLESQTSVEDLTKRLPDCAYTARVCLLTLALLRSGRQPEATQLVRDSFGPERSQAQCRRPPLLRCVMPELDRKALRDRLQSQDSAWRFVFFYQQTRGPRFDHILPSLVNAHVSFPTSLPNYENFWYINFAALARLLCAQLAPDQLLQDATEMDRWFLELQTGDADWVELAVFAQYCRRRQQLTWALEELRKARPKSVEMLRDFERRIAMVE